MTCEEAIKILQEERDYAQPLSYVNEALDIAKDALRKQIPKQPKVVITGASEWDMKFYCPECNGRVKIGRFCGHCGQSIVFRRSMT